eukprot:ctg_2867.g484
MVDPDRSLHVCDYTPITPAEGITRLAGLAIPVFSLRSRTSCGVGEFVDLEPLVDLAVQLNLSLIQLLPLNDTCVFGNWRDCYPYSSLSVHALHPTGRGALPPERASAYRLRCHDPRQDALGAAHVSARQRALPARPGLSQVLQRQPGVAGAVRGDPLSGRREWHRRFHPLGPAPARHHGRAGGARLARLAPFRPRRHVLLPAVSPAPAVETCQRVCRQQRGDPQRRSAHRGARQQRRRVDAAASLPPGPPDRRATRSVRRVRSELGLSHLQLGRHGAGRL